MLTKPILSSLLLITSLFIDEISSQTAPAPPPQPHWCPPTHPYKGGKLTGPFGQDCTPSQGDCPGACPVGEKGKPMYQSLKSTNGVVSCGVNFDCCSCLLIECLDCVELNCNGDQGCFGAKNIQITGVKPPGGNGALISCNGDLSCKETVVRGTDIARISCTGDQSCQFSRMSLTCVTTGCPLECVGDNSCSSDPLVWGNNAVFQITNSYGVQCSAAACQYGYFNLGSNKGGSIGCSAYDACKGSTIIADQGITGMTCGGLDACRGAAIYLTNPAQEFALFCGAAFACEGLQIYITITDPKITALGSISCNGASACENMKVMIITQPPKYPRTQELTVASLNCGAPKACANVQITKSVNVKFTDCFCPTSSLPSDAACNGLKGLGTQCDPPAPPAPAPAAV